MSEQERIQYLMDNHGLFVSILKMGNIIVVAFILGFMLMGVFDILRKVVAEWKTYQQIKEYKALILRKQSEIEKEDEQMDRYLQLRLRLDRLIRSQQR
jgi:hypothetical protein